MNQTNTTAYSIIWKEFNSNSPQGKHLGAEQDFALPYLVTGGEKEKFEAGNLQNLKQINLLMGILVGFNDNPPAVDINYPKSFFSKVLEDLKVHFGYGTIETMILNISSYIRKELGDKISVIALSSGTELLPDSSKVKFDCCVDLYNLLERNEYENRTEGLGLLNNLLSDVDESGIDKDFVHHLNSLKSLANQ